VRRIAIYDSDCHPQVACSIQAWNCLFGAKEGCLATFLFAERSFLVFLNSRQLIRRFPLFFLATGVHRTVKERVHGHAEDV
jgi:hypothetical protein